MAEPRKIRITSEDLAQFAAESRGRTVDWVMSLRDDNERLRALNAELLAALELAIPHIHHDPDTLGKACAARDKAREAQP